MRRIGLEGWRTLAVRAMGFLVAVACGSALVTAVQASTAHATSCQQGDYFERIWLAKRGVEALGPATDPGDPGGVAADWPDQGSLSAEYQELELGGPWGPYCEPLGRPR